MCLTLSLLACLGPALSSESQVPTSIQGNVTWLDASDPDGDFVPGGSLVSGTTWIDKSSANSADATQSVAINRPTVIPGAWNSRSILRFDGNDYMDVSSTAFGMLNDVAGATLFAVASTTATSGQRVFMISTGGNSRQTRAGVNFYDGFGTSIAGSGDFGAAGRRLDSDPFQRIEGGTAVSGQLEQFAATFDYSAGELSLFVDGALETLATNFQSPGNTSGTNSLNIRVGADSDLSSLHGAFRGDLAEVIVYDRVLSVSERAQIEDYLRSKWFGDSGEAFCAGDGTATPCPCVDGTAGHGCANSAGPGSVLIGSGTPDTGNDTFQLCVTGSVPSTPGLLFQGSAAIAGGNGNPVGNGLLCASPQKRWFVQFADSSGGVVYGPGLLGTDPAATPGATLLYQWWFRDNADSCGGGFNFSNAWSTTWM